MRFSVPLWTIESYAHDRRKHRHRCRVCRRNIDTGERVLMAKVKAKKTWAIHEACADGLVIPERDATWRDWMREHAFKYQLACFGYSETNPAHYAKVAKFRADAGAPILR